MADPRVPESALRDTIDGIDELEFIERGGQGDTWRLRRGGGGDEVLKVIVGADLARVRGAKTTTQTDWIRRSAAVKKTSPKRRMRG